LELTNTRRKCPVSLLTGYRYSSVSCIVKAQAQYRLGRLPAVFRDDQIIGQPLLVVAL